MRSPSGFAVADAVATCAKPTIAVPVRTGLPVYIVAAFIKRMAQLALTAPPAGCMLLLPVIYNLLQRHPTCKCMIHRERKRVLDGSEAADGGVDPPQTASSSTTVSNPDRGSNDPFVAEENDPARANALGSSLWELEALKRHSFPPVAKLVKVFSADFTKPVRQQVQPSLAPHPT